PGDLLNRFETEADDADVLDGEPSIRESINVVLRFGVGADGSKDSVVDGRRVRTARSIIMCKGGLRLGRPGSHLISVHTPHSKDRRCTRRSGCLNVCWTVSR